MMVVAVPETRPADENRRALFLAPARDDHQPVLDGLRGLAILIVLLAHLTNSTYLPQPGLLGAGKAGVYLFFVLSAFLLTAGLLARSPQDLRVPATWADYALRRVLRIWPLYLSILVASLALARAGVGFWPYPMTVAEFADHLVLREGKSVLWSIPVEFRFYLWLPVVAVLLAALGRTRFAAAWIAGLAVLVLGVVEWAWPAAESAANDVRLGPYLPVFLCGSLAAWLHRDHAQRWPRPAWGLLGLMALLAVAATLPSVVATMERGAFDPGVSHRWFLFFGIAWATLLLAVLHGPRWLSGLFASRPMRFLGVVSYSMYLLHMPVIEAFTAAGALGRPWGLPVVVLAVLVVSACSFLVFERPFRNVRWRRRAGPR